MALSRPKAELPNCPIDRNRHWNPTFRRPDLREIADNLQTDLATLYGWTTQSGWARFTRVLLPQSGKGAGINGNLDICCPGSDDVLFEATREEVCIIFIVADGRDSRGILLAPREEKCDVYERLGLWGFYDCDLDVEPLCEEFENTEARVIELV